MASTAYDAVCGAVHHGSWRSQDKGSRRQKGPLTADATDNAALASGQVVYGQAPLPVLTGWPAFAVVAVKRRF